MDKEIKYFDDEFKIQPLTPPFFVPSGVLMDRREAWEKREWIGTFNLWIVQSTPVPSIVYQIRNPNIGWAPGKLDVAVAGHYENLEGIEGGLREVREEIDKDYRLEQMIFLGKRLNVGVGQDGTRRQTVSDLFLIEDNSSLSTFNLQKKELYAICSLPVDLLLKVHSEKDFTFKNQAKTAKGGNIEIEVNSAKFPPNWDPYHFKIAMIVDRYFKGDKRLIY